jgi:Trk K+ transport system NAD-binding subunit
MNDIVWLTMRRIRTPLITLILVYSFSVLGMVLIPGQDAQGNAITLSYLDAAYFIAILETSIGFGEIPASFTDAQRLYVLIILLPNVVAWLYSIGTILALFIDPQFRAVLERSRFTRRVQGMHEGFYIVCGFGQTGNLIVPSLLRRGINAVVIEQRQDLVHSMSLNDLTASVPALAGDVSNSATLADAGLHHRNCLGVMALTNDDHANLTIAISSKLLRPDLTVLARSETPRITANMTSFGTDFVLDPYAIFAERLHLALSAPVKYAALDWLISVPGSELWEPRQPPAGRWLICGLGHLGSLIAQKFEELAVPYTVIDVHPDRVSGRPGSVQGRGSEPHTLLEAGVMEAVGIVACTGDDIDNLSIVMTTRELNPRLFVVTRQEQRENDPLFDACGADVVARRGVIMARQALLVATTPLLETFLQHLTRQDESFAQRVTARLHPMLEGKAPAIWVAHLSGNMATDLVKAKQDGITIDLSHLLHNSREVARQRLPCLCLLLERGASRTFLPEHTQDLHVGDRLLFAGRESAQHEIAWSLTEPGTLIESATGRIMPEGTVRRWLARRHAN